MQSEDLPIENRVANSALKTFNLEDHYPSGQRTTLNLSQLLYEGFILKEKDFRAALKAHDWSQYQDQHLSLIYLQSSHLPKHPCLVDKNPLQNNYHNNHFLQDHLGQYHRNNHSKKERLH